MPKVYDLPQLRVFCFFIFTMINVSYLPTMWSSYAFPYDVFLFHVAFLPLQNVLEVVL